MCNITNLMLFLVLILIIFIFLKAQKQVFNLMKFDSYPRFIKSDLFKMCLVEQMAESTPYIDQDAPLLKSQYLNKKVINVY